MAAPAGAMVGAAEESSSSDDEQRRRCQEAVWETQTSTGGGSSVKESKRVVVADHEHDGNELQVTQGFRAHVAKKLGHYLDSCISEMRPETLLESAKCTDDDDDEGFRLFSTSVPGQEAGDPPAPARRRPVPSSSDSDSEMETRLKEAAVSLRDLLPSATLPSALSPASTEPRCSEKVAEGGESHTVRKKKRRKHNEEASEQVDSTPQGLRDSEQEHRRVKVKRKKTKRREENAEQETLN